MTFRFNHLVLVTILTLLLSQLALGQTETSPTEGVAGTGTRDFNPAGTTKLLLGYNPLPTQSGIIEIKYALKIRGDVRLQILDTAGHPLRTLVEEFKERGSYTFQLKPDTLFLAPGKYLCRIESNGYALTRPINW